MALALVCLVAFALRASAVKPACTLSNVLPLSDVPDSKICPFVWAKGLNSPRGLEVASNNDVLVLEAGDAQISVLWDADGDGTSNSSERAVLVKQSGLNHAVAISKSGGFVYASSPTDVYRWEYTAGTREALGTVQHVISGLPCCHHTTRTLRFSLDESQLYVQSGSGSNEDPDSTHAQIRRFNVSSFKPTSAITWSSGELFASGLRNSVAFRIDPSGVAYGADNGVDDVSRPDWNIGDFHNDNPCEEINELKEPGKFYGYPYCWSEGILPSPPGKGVGTQWVHQNFINTPPYSDAWCQNTQNVLPPLHCLPAHNAPLDIIFGSLTDASQYNKTAYVTSHGSWDRDPPDGYSVFFVTWDNNGTVSHEKFLAYQGPGATGNGWIRPVGLAFIDCPWKQCLLVSTDSENEIVGIAYNV